MIEMLRKVAKKTGSHSAKVLVKSAEFEEARCIAYKLFNQSIEDYCEGDMSWKDTVKELRDNLLAMDMPEHTEQECEVEED